jgi:PEP-CTERM motif
MKMWLRRTLRILLYIGLVGGIGGLAAPAQALASSIDLNAFFADPTVTVAPDSLSALLTEDPVTGFVLLSNDPGFGDPNVIIPGAGVSLVFDFAFTMGGAGNNDEFGAFIIDASTGSSIGTDFQFFTQATSTGMVSFDLSALTGQTLGLQFQLSALPGDTGLDSSVAIAQVRLETAPAVVPEPATWLLLASGLLGVGGQRRWAQGRQTRKNHT